MKAEEIINILKKEGLIEEKEVEFKNKKEKVFILKLKEELYDKDAIFTAAYYIIDDDNIVFIDKKEKEWLIYFFTNFEKIKQFFKFLINYVYFRKNNKENLKLKEELIRLFLSG
jgi:hypothetical protein